MPESTNQENQNTGLPSHLVRVLEERIELNEKIDKLRMFLRASTYKDLDKREQDDLREQLYHMENYTWVLLRRLKRGNPTGNF